MKLETGRMWLSALAALCCLLAAAPAMAGGTKYDKPKPYSKGSDKAKPREVESAFKSGAPAKAQITPDQAYRETLEWALGPLTDAQFTELRDRIERASYKHQVIFEFALSIVAAEAYYGKKVKGAPMSWARLDSWRFYDEQMESIGRQPMSRYPGVLDDLDTSLSELRLILNQSKTFEDVYTAYWSGPDRSFNTQTYNDFAVAVSKLYNGLKDISEQRKAAEDRDKYKSDYYNTPSPDWDEGGWAGLAYGDMQGYASHLSSMPRLASQLKQYPGFEDDYARTARRFNKKLSEAESIVIARAVLSYCEDTQWQVDPRLVMALVAAESAFKPKAVSRTGAMGLGQLMPATARGHGIRDAFDPVQNLYATVKYLERESYRWRKSSNKVDLILAAYNAGPGAVMKYKGVPPYRETQNYIKTVKKYYNDFRTSD